MFKVWKFPKWLIGFFMLIFISNMAYATETTQQHLQAKPKGKILVVMTNHSAYPTRSDTTGLWLTELTHFYDIALAAGHDRIRAEEPLDETLADRRPAGAAADGLQAGCRRHPAARVDCPHRVVRVDG